MIVFDARSMFSGLCRLFPLACSLPLFCLFLLLFFFFLTLCALIYFEQGMLYYLDQKVFLFGSPNELFTGEGLRRIVPQKRDW